MKILNVLLFCLIALTIKPFKKPTNKIITMILLHRSIQRYKINFKLSERTAIIDIGDTLQNYFSKKLKEFTGLNIKQEQKEKISGW